MSRRPELSLIFVGEDDLRRVDFGSTGAPRVHEQARAAGARASLAAALAELARAPSLARRALVCAEEAWTQVLELPAAALAGLEDEALARALAFELEPVSGLAAEESALAWRELGGAGPGLRRLWVTQLSRTALATSSAVLRAAGARAVGFVHPAGLLPAGARVEVWSSATFCTAADEVALVSAHPARRSWEVELARWLEARAPATELAWYAPEQVEPPPGSEAAVACVRRGAPLEALLAEGAARRAREALEGTSALPLVRVPRSESRRASWLGAASLSLAACLALGWAWRGREVHARGVEAQASGAEALSKESAALARRVDEARRARDEARARADAARAALERVEGAWEEQAERVVGLVDALASGAQPELVLVSVEPGSAGVEEVCGLALGDAPVDRFSAGVRARASASGWSTAPARSELLAQESGRRACRFLLELQPAALPSEARPRAERGERR